MLNFTPLGKTRVNHCPLCKQKMAPTWAQMPSYSRDNESNSTAPGLPHLMPVQIFPIIRPFSLEKLEPQLLPIFPKLYRALVISLGFFYDRDYSPKVKHVPKPRQAKPARIQDVLQESEMFPYPLSESWFFLPTPTAQDCLQKCPARSGLPAQPELTQMKQ